MKSVIVPLIISILLISLFFVFFPEMEPYFEKLIRTSSSNLTKYSLISFIVLASDILLPVPSSIVMFVNGIFLGFLNGALLSMASVILSSGVGYFIGSFSSFKSNSNKNQKSVALINKYGPVAIVITRGIPILSESICFTAGYNKINFKYFTLLNIIGYLPVCFLYSYFGSLGKNIDLFLITFSISILFSFVLFFIGNKILPGKLNYSEEKKIQD